MSTKTELLCLLEKSPAEWVSGEAAAQALGVSRAAIWKAAQALRQEGASLQSVSGRGYRLAPGTDHLSEAGLLARLPEPKPPVRVFEEVDSTNLEAKRWAMAGAPHGAMVAAVRQSAGRGRLGRSFESPPGGMYMSVVLRPTAERASSAVLVTTAAAVAACRAVQALCGISLDIKWVNDLYLNGKKCCGILTEASTGVESGAIEYMVVGIGINHSTPQEAFAPAVSAVATSLYPQGGAAVTRAHLAAAIYTQLMDAFERLPGRDFLEEYRRRSLVLGKRVTVMASPPYDAWAEVIDNEAGLVVRLADGTRRTLTYGEISVRPDMADPYVKEEA